MAAQRKSVTLVVGGARSGKSRYAQELASGFERVTFLATARPSDSEMRRRIAEHRRERNPQWKTVEAPANLHKAIRSEATKSDVLLIDCLTLYLAQVLNVKNGAQRGMQRRIQEVSEAIRASKASVIVVSNEVGSGIVPPFRSGRLYRDLLGQLNQQVARIADKVVLMVAGVPVTVKDHVARGMG